MVKLVTSDVIEIVDCNWLMADSVRHEMIIWEPLGAAIENVMEAVSCGTVRVYTNVELSKAGLIMNPEGSFSSIISRKAPVIEA